MTRLNRFRTASLVALACAIGVFLVPVRWWQLAAATAAMAVLVTAFSLLTDALRAGLQSGASVTIEAPTKVELVGPLLMRLIEGSLTAEVPPGAHGFTVETADLRVVDLGTRHQAEVALGHRQPRVGGAVGQSNGGEVKQDIHSDEQPAQRGRVATERGKPGLIAVDGQGQRFVNESLSYHEFVKAQLQAWRQGIRDAGIPQGE